MIEYEKFRLANGLEVLLHEAWDTPMATVNVLYRVGSRDEEPHLTGFAHLFEHLMFSGTEQVPDFDEAVSLLGGESNAFTNTDYTNYYITLPVQHLPEALRLEADRMANLRIGKRALEVQRSVVTEEYHQRYINQPYGDVWLRLRPLCYADHHYRWPTIGADIAHVGQATLEQVQAFGRRFYRPDNAVLAVAAPQPVALMRQLVEEAFGRAQRPEGEVARKQSDGPQTFHTGRRLQADAQVPATAVYVAFPMCGHEDPRFRACDLLSDVLSNGRSSRLFRRLVMGSDLFAEADACISGEEGPNLMVLSAKLKPGGNRAEEAVQLLLREAAALGDDEPATEAELEKVQNKFENTYVFSQYKAADRAMGLCHCTFLGDTALVNDEPLRYRALTASDLFCAAHDFLRPEAANIMIYGTER